LNNIHILEAAAKLTPDDLHWLKNRVDLAIAEYNPIFIQECPGKAMKDRFEALLTALKESPNVD